MNQPTNPYAQRDWTTWLSERLSISESEARFLMAAAEADLADAGNTEADYEVIAQLAADRGARR